MINLEILIAKLKEQEKRKVDKKVHHFGPYFFFFMYGPLMWLTHNMLHFPNILLWKKKGGGML